MSTKWKLVIVFVFLCFTPMIWKLMCASNHKALAKQRITHKSNSCSLVVSITYVYDAKHDIAYAITAPTSQYRTMCVVPYEKVKDVCLVITEK